MEFDSGRALKCLQLASATLPGLMETLSLSTTEIMILGACVFDIYFSQDWIPEFSRKTADIDISVGLYTGEADYAVLKDALLKLGYTNADVPPYRFYSPVRIPGALSYIDLLAHPISEKTTATQTREVIGVGEGFSFRGMDFAREAVLKITDKIFCPNPIGMVALKMAAFRDDPNNRVKDLADIAELAWGLVEKGKHFEMGDLWAQLKGHPSAKEVREALKELSSGESVKWDLEDARQELLKRPRLGPEIDDTIPARLKAWVDYLPEE